MNSSGLIYDASALQYGAWGVSGSLISALGLLGNVLSIIVLSDHRFRSSTSVYLICLAVVDMLVLVSMLLCFSLPAISNYTDQLDFYNSEIFPRMNPYAYPLALTAQTCSVFITVAFTIERYIVVCKPLKANKLCTVKRARRYAILVILISLIYNVPRWFEFKLSDTNDNNTTVQMLTALGDNQLYNYIYKVYMYTIIIVIGPFLFLLCLNAALVRTLHRANRNMQQSKHSAQEHNITVVIIIVVGTFLVCQLPSIPDNICGAIYSSAEVRESPNLIRLHTLSNLMVISNSAVNFFLYAVFGKKFRRVFRLKLNFCFGIPIKNQQHTDFTTIPMINTNNGAV
ncbi:DgyrCDS5321 [Dimorphilus gyrociliatus]|uniref:DgyrCDS5321 n=1 Tax=Dimorphilus gyrociliatus TaxID=2664684 RepID=A0A7I8VL68_9ANNE|nr:DgyrCDS5321 [Dimorphilus gyrociliatus]